MPPSALANLSAYKVIIAYLDLIRPKASLDLESPWMFQLRNPSNPAASTHAGVLEFIAEEGVVHLPYWVHILLRGILHVLDRFLDDEDTPSERRRSYPHNRRTARQGKARQAPGSDR